MRTGLFSPSLQWSSHSQRLLSFNQFQISGNKIYSEVKNGFSSVELRSKICTIFKLANELAGAFIIFKLWAQERKQSSKTLDWKTKRRTRLTRNWKCADRSCWENFRYLFLIDCRRLNKLLETYKKTWGSSVKPKEPKLDLTLRLLHKKGIHGRDTKCGIFLQAEKS